MKIDQFFRGECFTEIIENLEHAARLGDTWARSQLELIMKYVRAAVYAILKMNIIEF